MRPANIVTSVADVLAGIAISGFLANGSFQFQHLVPILLLCFSTIGLYGGGVVFNDVFDAELDRIERPERPIPVGLITIREAATLAVIMLIAGILAAGFTSLTSGILAFLIAVSALVYDKWGKHHSFAGPINMGLCRGFNLLLGISIIPSAVNNWWYLALVPVIYIASITMISRGKSMVEARKLYIQPHFYMPLLLALSFILLSLKEEFGLHLFSCYRLPG